LELYRYGIRQNEQTATGYEATGNFIALRPPEVELWRRQSAKAAGFRRMVRALARDMAAVEAINRGGTMSGYEIAIVNDADDRGLDSVWVPFGRKPKLSKMLVR
jgi:hypothetical protein